MAIFATARGLQCSGRMTNAPFAPTMIDLVERRQVLEHARIVTQALAALALLTSALWALL